MDGEEGAGVWMVVVGGVKRDGWGVGGGGGGG